MSSALHPITDISRSHFATTGQDGEAIRQMYQARLSGSDHFEWYRYPVPTVEVLALAFHVRVAFAVRLGNGFVRQRWQWSIPRKWF
jgi:hypothetical protein